MNFSLTKSGFIFLLSFLCFQSFGQTEEPKRANPEVKIIGQDTIYSFVDEPAEFPGGGEALKKYISDNLNYPEVAKENGLEGKCYLQFIVSMHGYVSNVKIKRGVTDCPECDVEAIRLVKGMPKWIPGKVNGKNVNTTFSLPITFKL